MYSPGAFGTPPAPLSRHPSFILLDDEVRVSDVDEGDEVDEVQVSDVEVSDVEGDEDLDLLGLDG